MAVKPAVDKIEDAESSAGLSDQFQVGFPWALHTHLNSRRTPPKPKLTARTPK
jgi:hypothetical protein